MFFNPQVKDRIEDFFNHEILREKLKAAIDDKITPIIAVFGLRRTGKTSLIRVVLNLMKKKYIWIDGREINSREEFYQKLTEETSKHKGLKLEKISIKGFELSFRSNKDWDYLNKHKIIMVVDEAQLLKRFKLDSIIAYVYDNYPKIKIILSGSEMGMLLSFLGKNKAKAPLYGRAIFELQTNRLIPDNSRTFLIEGAKQAGKVFKEEEVLEVLAKIDGIIGWLTKYGWYRLRFSHKEALGKTIEEGKEIVREDFLRFAAKAEARYKMIIKSLKGGAKWQGIASQIKLSDSQLYLMLKRLTDHGFIEKQDGIYRIADPLLEAAF